MSISVLPSELIYLIVLQVGFDLFLDPEKRPHDYVADSSLASLARVSKQFLQPAREVLLARPLQTKRIPSWTAAIQFVEALTMNGRALGKRIWCLEHVGRWIRTLQGTEPPSKLPYQPRGYSAAFSWYLQLLRVCPRLQAVDLVFTSQFELNKVIKALAAAALNSLVSVRFVGFNKTPEATFSSTLSFELVHEALKTHELYWIEYLYLYDVSFETLSTPPLPLNPSLPVTLAIEGRAINSLAQCYTALPEVSSELVDLFLNTSSTYTDPYLVPILQHLSHRFESLTLLFYDDRYYPPTLRQYRPAPLHFTFPLDQFSRFPNLNRLTLRSFVGISLTFLRQLSNFCPSISTLEFRKSYWIPDDSTIRFEASDKYFKVIFEEEEVLAVLKKFRHLKRVDLGYLPTTNPEEYPKVRMEMRGRGIFCAWECCADY